MTESFQVTLRSLARQHSLPCQESTALISQALDRKLPLHQRLLLRLHLFGCLACVRFQTQVRFLHDLLRRQGQQIEQARAPGQRLSAAARARICLTLQQAAGR
jgi:hypothetical protein